MNQKSTKQVQVFRTKELALAWLGVEEGGVKEEAGG